MVRVIWSRQCTQPGRASVKRASKMAKVHMHATAPNLTEDGARRVPAPERARGTWRGRDGYHAIRQVLERTRFTIRPDADSPELWCAWNLVSTALLPTAKSPKVPPLMCTVCGEVPARVSFMNLVSSSKSSGQCACSWRPEHASAEGYARLSEHVGASNHELVDPGGEAWVAMHLRRSPRWELVQVRCKACGRARHVCSSGLVRRKPMSKCICARTPLVQVPRKARATKKALAAKKAKSPPASPPPASPCGLQPSDEEDC
jgi:hypothetical protein